MAANQSALFSASSPEDFVRQLLPLAEEVGKELGVDPLTLITHAAAETGYGQHMVGNNLFNIKAGPGWKGATTSADTTEYRNGVAAKEKANFRAYGSVADSLKDIGGFLRGDKRYANAIGTGNNAAAYVAGLQEGGYATDPNYKTNFGSVYKRVSATAANDDLSDFSQPASVVAAAIAPAPSAPLPQDDDLSDFSQPASAITQAAPQEDDLSDFSQPMSAQVQAPAPRAVAAPTAAPTGEQSFMDSITNPLKSGWYQVKQGMNPALLDTGIMDSKGVAENIASDQRIIEGIPVPSYVKETQQRANEAAAKYAGQSTFGDVMDWLIERSNKPMNKLSPLGLVTPTLLQGIKDVVPSRAGLAATGEYIKNPKAAANVVLQSAASSIAPIIMGAGGGTIGGSAGGPLGVAVGAALGAGSGSFITEYGSDIIGTLAENKIDLKDATAIEKALNDPVFMAQARKHALKRGASVALFDALSAGTAGRIAKPIERILSKTGAPVGGKVGRKIIGEATEVLKEGEFGAAGEQLAQETTGDKPDPSAIAGERIGEYGPGVAEIAIQRAIHSRYVRIRAAKINAIREQNLTESEQAKAEAQAAVDAETQARAEVQKETAATSQNAAATEATQPTPDSTNSGKSTPSESASVTMPPSVEADSPAPESVAPKASAPISETAQGSASQPTDKTAPSTALSTAPTETTGETPTTQVAPLTPAPKAKGKRKAKAAAPTAPAPTVTPPIAPDDDQQKTEVPPAQTAPPVSTPAPTPHVEPVTQPGEVEAGGTTPARPKPTEIFRGTESDNETARTRFSPDGEVGKAIYATENRELASSYGGGPKAKEGSGRTVHSLNITPLKDTEYGYIEGGSKIDEPARFVDSTGKTILEYEPTKKSGAADRARIQQLAKDNGIKVIVGMPGSVAHNQVAVVDESVLIPDTPSERMLAALGEARKHRQEHIVQRIETRMRHMGIPVPPRPSPKEEDVTYGRSAATAPASQTPVSKGETATTPVAEQLTKAEAALKKTAETYNSLLAQRNSAEAGGDKAKADQLTQQMTVLQKRAATIKKQVDALRKTAAQQTTPPAIKQNQPAKRTAKPKSTESRLGDIAPGYTDEEHNAPDDADSGMTVDEGDDNAQAEFERLLARQNQESAGTGTGISGRQDDSSGRGSRDVSRQGSRSEGTPTGNRSPREDRRAASEGKPLKVHRGAHAALTPEHYNDDALGFASGHPSSGLGVWFTNDESETPRFGPIQSSHDVDIRNPRVYTPSDPIPPFNSLEEAATLRRSLKAQGYDGVVQDYRSVQGPVHYVSFDASQVKDAAAAIEPPSQAQIDEASNTEPEEFDLSSEFDDDETDGGFTLADQNLAAKTGGTPTGQPVTPRAGTAPSDPLRALAARKADQAREAIERKDTTPEVAPKRDTQLGQSTFDSMWRDFLGMPDVGPQTPAKEEQLRRIQGAPMTEQIKIATKEVSKRFGFKKLSIDPKLNSREAMDVLLDAYNNLHTMSNVMSLPVQAMSFNGNLSLELTKRIGKSKGTRGSFRWNFEEGFDASVITLARRADSFTHEWIHALDINLLMRFYKTRVKGVSALSAFSTEPLNALPPEINKAFTDVMRSLFLVDEAAAQEMAKLSAEATLHSAELAKAKARKVSSNPTVRAKRDAELDTLQRLFDSKINAITDLLNKQGSALHHNSLYVDALAGQKYFSIPTEMLARAGEAWMANRIGQQAGTEFLTGDPNFYNDNADRIMNLVYPNAAEREGIFQKFDALFAALSKEQYFKGDTAAARIPGETMMDKELAQAAMASEEAGAAKRAYDSVKNDAVNVAMAAANAVTGKSNAAVAEAASGAVENFKGSSLTTSFWSAAGRMDGLIRAYKKNPVAQALIRKFARMLALNPGAREETSGPTAQDKIDRRINIHQKTVDNIVKAFDLDPSDQKQMAELYEETVRPTEQVRQELKDHNEFLQEQLADPNITPNRRVNLEANLKANNERLRMTPLPQAPSESIQKAANAIRKLQNQLYYEAQQAGIDIGYVSNYLRRALNHKAVDANQAGFIEKATLAYEATNALNARKLEREIAKTDSKQKKAALEAELAEIKQLNPKTQAENYLWSLQVPDVATPNGLTTPSTSFTKHRTLAPAADLLLADFYDQNPIRSLYNSISASVYRTTFAEMFGANGEKLDVMRKDMIAAGVKPSDLPLLEDAMRIAFGQTGNFVSPTDAFVNWAMLLGQIKMLGKSAFVNFFEPAVAGIRTGNLLDSFEALARTYLPVLNRGDSAEQNLIMEILGLVASTAHETVFANRSGLSGDNALLRKVYTGFGKITKLQWLTERGRAGTFRVLANYLHHISLRAADAEGARASEAHDELNELGIPRDKHAAFSEFMRSMPKGRIGLDMLMKSGNQEMKEMYGNAMHVLMRQSIQSAQRVERARGSFHPLGRFIYSITNFTRSFERNVIARNAKLIYSAKGGDRKFYAAARFGSTAGALVLMTILSSMARDWWDDPEYAKKKLKGGEYTSGKGIISAIDRSGFTGRFTLAYNAIMKQKFDREVSALTAGAVPSFYIDSFSKMVMGFKGSASAKQERDAWGAAYDLLVGIGAPLGFILAKATGPIGWLGSTKLQSRGFREAAATRLSPKTRKELHTQNLANPNNPANAGKAEVDAIKSQVAEQTAEATQEVEDIKTELERSIADYLEN